MQPISIKFLRYNFTVSDHNWYFLLLDLQQYKHSTSKYDGLVACGFDQQRKLHMISSHSCAPLLRWILVAARCWLGLSIWTKTSRRPLLTQSNCPFGQVKQANRGKNSDRARMQGPHISLYHHSPLGLLAWLTKAGGSTNPEGTASSSISTLPCSLLCNLITGQKEHSLWARAPHSKDLTDHMEMIQFRVEVW